MSDQKKKCSSCDGLGYHREETVFDDQEHYQYSSLTGEPAYTDTQCSLCNGTGEVSA